MRILIPMAGVGSRFQESGYDLPKPLIDTLGKPMVQRVVESIDIDAEYIYVVQSSHFQDYGLHSILNGITPDCRIVQIEGTTEGAACTTLLAKELINNSDSLLIVNSDNVFEWDSNSFVYEMSSDSIDGGILTFTATDPKWSFVKMDEDGFATEVAEKNPISNIATAGAYFWKNGADYVACAEQMINKNIRTNNEFYVCPVYNEAIENNLKISIFHIEKMWGLGTPEDLNYYIEHYPHGS